MDNTATRPHELTITAMQVAKTGELLIYLSADFRDPAVAYWTRRGCEVRAVDIHVDAEGTFTYYSRNPEHANG